MTALKIAALPMPTSSQTIPLPQAVFALKRAVQDDLRRKDTAFTVARAEVTALRPVVEVANPGEAHRLAIRQLQLIETLLSQGRHALALSQITAFADFIAGTDELARLGVAHEAAPPQTVETAFAAFQEAYHQSQMTGRDMVVPQEAWATLSAYWEHAGEATLQPAQAEAIAMARKWVAEDGFAGRVCAQLLQRIHQLELAQAKAQIGALPPTKPASVVLFDSSVG